MIGTHSYYSANRGQQNVIVNIRGWGTNRKHEIETLILRTSANNKTISVQLGTFFSQPPVHVYLPSIVEVETSRKVMRVASEQGGFG